MNEAQKRSARLLGLMPLIKAHSEGKLIEFKPLGQPNQPWRIAQTPVWSYQDEYRIKPEPRTVTVLINPGGTILRTWNNWQEYAIAVEAPETCLRRMNSNGLSGYTLATFTENVAK